MECNKDEATRAKEIAVRKFIAKDTLGAKKFALKAQNLFPALEGIPQMIATLDVYIAAENKINGEADWYGILGANPLADDDTVRKQYRKLALILHPDKNKSIGADGAFKLISEAWSLLSDKAKKAAYDEKRNAKTQKGSTMFGGSSAKTGANGAYNVKKKTTSSARTQKNTAKEHPSSSTKKLKPTFWTTCNRCKMQYEYLRVYHNLKLLCPNCHEAFLAVETDPPPASGIRPATSWTFSQSQQKSDHQAPNKSKSNAGKKNMAAPNVGPGPCSKTNITSFEWAPFSKTSGVSNVAQAATVVQQAYDKVKRDREEAQAATKREDAIRRKQYVSKRKRGGMEGASVSNHGKGPVGASEQGNFEYTRVRKISPVELQNLLVEKARKEIRMKIGEFHSNTQGNSVCAQNNIGESEDKKSRTPTYRPLAVTTFDKICTNVLDTVPEDVPDPDFHEFYKDRTERSFSENQVWAAYDDDGMPRYYAMIHRVISMNPFKIKISWLYPNTNSEPGSINWVAFGFSKTNGDFRTGRHEIFNSVNYFSHKVRWRKGNDGAICIYPREGDVWAVYRNWSPDWNELTPDEIINKFDMVEILEDFIEERGVTVIPLVKVAGFKAVFHHHFDIREIKTIPREEMFRFSHQVPSHLLTGEEASNAPKGCRVLHPAATPFELLEVIKVAEEEDNMVVDTNDRVLRVTSDKMKEANCEEAIGDTGKLGEEKVGQNKDIQGIENSEKNKGKMICSSLLQGVVICD